MKGTEDRGSDAQRLSNELFDYLFLAVAEVYINGASDYCVVKVIFSRDKRFYEGHTLTHEQAKQILLSPSSVSATFDADCLRDVTIKDLAEMTGKRRFCYCIEPKNGILKRRILTLYVVQPGKRIIATVSEAEHSDGGDLVFRLNKSEYVIRRSDIIYVDYGNHSVVVHDLSGKRSFFSVSFGDVADELLADRNFVRSYKNCIVNMDRVRKLENDAFIMENGDVISIPKRRLREIKAYYEAYLVLRGNPQ